MTTAQREAIEKHGRNLLAIFPDATEQDPVKLCKKLRRLEANGHQLAEDRCNRDMSESEHCRRTDAVLNPLDRLLGYRDAGVPVFLNGDPRGYALKIESEYVADNGLDIHRDWGGYGVLAPEIGKDGNQ